MSTACVASTSPTSGSAGEGEAEPTAPSPEAFVREPSAEEEASNIADDDSQIFTRTIVVIDEDGTQRVSSGPITRAEQKEETAQRLASAASPRKVGLSPDVIVEACNSSNYTILYSQPNWTGNETCFYNNSATPAAVDLLYYRQSSLLGSPAWYQCTGLHQLGGSCINGGHSAVMSYVSFENGCFSNESSTLRSFYFYNFIGANPNAGANVGSYEFLWLGANGASCTAPPIRIGFRGDAATRG